MTSFSTKNGFIFLLLLVVPFTIIAQVQTEWVKHWGGTDADNLRAIKKDAAGNFVMTGFFIGTTDFDPGPNIMSRSSGGSHEVFISKFDSAGNFLWVRDINGGGA